RLTYTSEAGETIREPHSYGIKVLPDRIPQVTLTRPGKDIELPANGVLQVGGMATDDFGIKDLTLRMQGNDGNNHYELAPKRYRDGKPLLNSVGRYPLIVEYQDFVELSQVETAAKKVFQLKKGMELEYWLEARDNCDYPEKNKNGQVGRSKAHKANVPDQESK